MLGTKILEERDSEYNGHLNVKRTFGLGTYIQAEGLTQSGGIVETIWKTTLKKIRKERINKVLILGLGGGTVAKIIQKNWPAAKIVGVDIDPMMIDLGKKYLDLGEVDIRIKIGDAYTFDSTGFDLVIVDLYNGEKFPRKFEDEKFLRPLKNNNIVVFNRTFYGDKKPEAIKFGKKLEKIFPRVEQFRPEVNLMFLCSK